MNTYHIGCSKPLEHLLEISCIFRNISSANISLHIPAWRPGRYELQNYAKNIDKVLVRSLEGENLPCKKSSKDTWEIQTLGNSEIKVSYHYYAFQLDAGGCFVDDKQVYLNFSNCLLYQIESVDEPCEVVLDIPPHFSVACALEKKNKNTLLANNYHHLVDSPLLASYTMQYNSYQVANTNFHIWINGEWRVDWAFLLQDFEKFTKAQIALMGEFPEDNYHFLCQIVPYKFYHGVEHQASTVVCIGASEEMNHSEEAYQDFLSLCSHELFHAWNVCKIRPIEMMPYQYHQETYFESGFVAEGITTYYGELALLRGGIWTPQQFLDEMNKILKKHNDNFGWLNYSLTEASWDLWLDGYKTTMPNRTVSIYHKGAIVAMMLDLEIRLKSYQKYSLDDVMRAMWVKFGKTQKGYTLQDFQRVCEESTQVSLQNFFNLYIKGIEPLKDYLSELVENFALKLATIHYNGGTEIFGFQTTTKNNACIVHIIEPNSNAAKVLSLDDEIIAINDRKVENNNINALIGSKQNIMLTLFRQKHLYHVILNVNTEDYLKNYQLRTQSTAENSKKENLVSWLG
ncbi:MAG: M61 family peptidase [Thermonemataceae bacterium]|nr:M61 family peptidase [Thermonemataceae bacterium]